MERYTDVKTSSGEYQVVIGTNLNIGEQLKKIHRECRVLLVSDDTVFALYGEDTVKSLEDSGFTVDTFVFTHGEQSKNINTMNDILEYAGSCHLTRTDMMAALGGGVVGDITGFCSAVYLRGIDFVQIPTTVLAAVDSSVGGKTAIDLKAGKNLAGAFHQPVGVFLDVNRFNSLPDDIFSEGLAEAIKAGMIQDSELFEIFEKADSTETGRRFGLDMVDICARCIEIKAKVVQIDEFDTGLRRILNFGHTPAHAIEILSGLKISHGKAVAVGMVIMTKTSERLGKIPTGSTERLIKVLNKFGLPSVCDYNAEEMAEIGAVDKKRTGKTMGIILLEKIGQAYVETIPADRLSEYFDTTLFTNRD